MPLFSSQCVAVRAYVYWTSKTREQEEQEGAGGLREEEAKLKVPYDSVAFQSKCTDEYQVETLETKCAEEQELFATLSRHTSTGCRCVQRMLR